jgi:hypothetical protein
MNARVIMVNGVARTFSKRDFVNEGMKQSIYYSIEPGELPQQGAVCPHQGIFIHKDGFVSIPAQ